MSVRYHGAVVVDFNNRDRHGYVRVGLDAVPGPPYFMGGTYHLCEDEVLLDGVLMELAGPLAFFDVDWNTA